MRKVMDAGGPYRGKARASGLLRTLVVASATLAILLVCFSMYQFSQLEPEPARAVPPRLPAPSTPAVADRTAAAAAEVPGVSVGQAVIGPARDIRLSFYPREGTRARGEIAIQSWAPIEGAANEFRLTAPEVRMRTNDGRAVRATAPQGILEAPRQGGGVDPRRGRLTGGVVIEIDRLTEAERAALPEAMGAAAKPDPAQLIRIEMEEIEFDLEYSKVVVPRGRFHLSARDIDFRASDLAIRFNEEEGRIESMRINDGGRLVLRELGEQFGLSIPRTEGKPEQRATLVNWLRTSLQSALEAQNPPDRGEEPTEGKSADGETEDGMPVFRADSPEKDEAARPPVRYFARFAGDVDARQLVGDTMQARLRADVLEILRAFTAEDKQRVRSTPVGQAPASGEADLLPPAEQIILEWTGRLVLEAVSPEDQRWSEEAPAKITAKGSPVRIASPQGKAACTTLTFDPDGSKVWLEGTEDDPVQVRSEDQGVMSGVQVYTERRDDELYVRITGPGTLVRDPQAESATPSSPDEREVSSMVEFDEQLELRGRFVTRTKLDFTGTISSREYRVFDEAIFRGRVRMREGDTGLHADTVTLTFGEKRNRGRGQQTVERMQGSGRVVMTQGDDRVTCREIDLLLATDHEGKTVPVTATAKGDVEATQNRRTISARDQLTVDFATVSRPPPPFDLARGRAEAVAAGLNPAEIDWEARRREHESRPRTEIGVRHLKAFGAVRIVDPAQELDLQAEQVDCAVVDGREIEEAFVAGDEARPASVRLNSFTVTGREIHLDVPDEWAQVPGAGRMTFNSRKDLDGRTVKEPIPISITWQEQMKYQGRENRAVFLGGVHATSATTTTFDCRQLVVEFEDVAEAPGDSPSQDWWILQEAVDRLAGDDRNADDGVVSRVRFSKEPVYLLASGRATAETSEIDEATGRLESRARLSGPKLSVDLRPEVSKMLIEGAGTLLLEDFRPAPEPDADRPRPRREGKGLFSIDEQAGPSKTLIEWEEFMWYDFSIDQTRFEGNVSLKHFSGAALERRFGRAAGGSADMPEGRSTFLTCEVLTVDFFDRDERPRRTEDQRMGRLSADRLRQFQASRAVELQDESEGLSVSADRIIYERDRDILAIYGAPRRRAVVARQKPGEPPQVVTVQRAFYDLVAGQIELHDTTYGGR